MGDCGGGGVYSLLSRWKIRFVDEWMSRFVDEWMNQATL